MNGKYYNYLNVCGVDGLERNIDLERKLEDLFTMGKMEQNIEHGEDGIRVSMSNNAKESESLDEESGGSKSFKYGKTPKRIEIENAMVCFHLVQEGFAKMYLTAERSQHANQIKNTEDNAKNAKKRIWTNYAGEEDSVRIKFPIPTILLSSFPPTLHFY